MNVGGAAGRGDPPGAVHVCVFVVGAGALAQAFVDAELDALAEADAVADGETEELADGAAAGLSPLRELRTIATTAASTTARPATTAMIWLRRCC
jgi:hypothetical protein